MGYGWHAGVLMGLAEGLGFDARKSGLVVGTSVGSVVGAVLRAGIGAGDIYARTTGGAISDEARTRLAEAGMTAPPTMPAPSPARRLGPASPRLVARTALAPWRLRLGLLVAGGLPRGSVDTAVISSGVGALHGSGWPDAPFWVCAVRLDDGRRVVFGRDGAPSVGVGTAVGASCAIPGYFTPVAIDGHEFVDGGAHSPTNADLASATRPDVVVISSPMSLDASALRRPSAARAVRIGHRVSLQRELVLLRRAGTAFVTLQPGPGDLEVMGPGGADAMDPRRRDAVARQARATTLRRLESPRMQEALAALTP